MKEAAGVNLSGVELGGRPSMRLQMPPALLT